MTRSEDKRVQSAGAMLDNEARLAALARYGIVGTPEEPGFDDLARLAAQICDTSIGMITFVDGRQQFFKARVGFNGGPEAPMDAGFCPLVVRVGAAVIIPDAANDPIHADNAATTEGGIRFYAGTPLITGDNQVLGTLCVLDTQPRPDGLSQQKRDALDALARQVMSQLELRRETSERHRGQQALQDLADVVPQIVWSADADGRLDFFNRQWSDYTGLSFHPERADDIVGHFVHPDDLDHTLTAFGQALRTGENLELEHRMRAADGRYRWFLVRAQPHRDPESGQIAKWFGSSTDIHDRYATQQRLASEQSMFRAFIEHLPIGVCLVDTGGQVQLSNEAYRRFLPSEPIPSLAKSAVDLERWEAWDADGRKLRRDEYVGARALRGELVAPGQEFLFHAPDGKDVWTQVLGVPLRDAEGNVAATAIVILDVDAQKQAQNDLRRSNEELERKVRERTRTLRASEERAAVYFNFAEELLMLVRVETDGEIRIENTNPAATAVLGRDPADIIGKRVEAILPPATAADIMLYGRACAASRQPQFYQAERRAHNGEPVYLDIRVAFTQQAEDGSAVVLFSGRDVTRQRAIEDALRQSQKMEAVGQLTGGLAHDFNNLLAVITGSLELIALRISQGRSSEIDKFATAAQTATRRAAALTHRLLAFSRRQTLDPKPTDINALVEGMKDMVNRTIGPEITLHIVENADRWTTLVDPSQLENALLNLCINARDAMPDGGRLTIETANIQLDPVQAANRDLPPGEYIGLSVSDTGTGMSPELIVRVFEPFFTTKPTGEGTGLGLSMVYGFARQSDGQVRIHSEVGHGTTVTIYLPRSKVGAVAQAHAERVMPDRIDRRRTVMVVDDEAHIRMLIVDVLHDLGCDVIEAHDGRSGLQLLQSATTIDLLITDVGMPGGVNGRQMADAARVTRPGLKTIFVTGYAETAAVTHGHLDPTMAVMTKPFAIDVLANRVKTMLES